MHVTVRLDNGRTKRVVTPPHIGKLQLPLMTEHTQKQMLGGVAQQRTNRSIHGRVVNL